jgi:hypothetical protein
VQLGSGGAEEHDGVADRPVREVVDEVEQAGIGPVQILEDEHERSGLGERLEQTTPRREGLLPAGASCRRLERQQRPDVSFQPSGVSPIGHEVGDRAGELPLDRPAVVALEDRRLLLHHLAERPVRDPVAVRQAPATPPRHEARVVREGALELPDEPALADPRDADERDELDRERSPRARDRV